ncbi:MAG: arsenite methyltransferase [Gemmatimonadota bacterium]
MSKAVATRAVPQPEQLVLEKSCCQSEPDPRQTSASCCGGGAVEKCCQGEDDGASGERCSGEEGEGCGCQARKAGALANETAVHQAVREGYSTIAAGQSACGGGCCGQSDVEALAQRMGYSEAELASLPEGANMGLSCGNPTALAELQPGETVLDLGSGGGFDVYLAGQKVGAGGRALGVDMTAAMVDRARGGIAAYRERTGLDNVEFRLGEIEHLPVADASVDAVISNCVVNLSPDKPQVWREMARVLKPGGRVAVSDLALRQPLPGQVRNMVEALVGCVAGAVLVSQTEAMAREAGLVDVVLAEEPGYIETMEAWQDPLYAAILEALPPEARLADYVTSLNVRARRPG